MSTLPYTPSSINQQRYLPFGGARTDVPTPNGAATDFAYTGQRLLDGDMGGLMDYKARFYSPYLGRFLQPDTLIPDPSNSQTWNRHSYVHNQPVNFNDPTGHMRIGENGSSKKGCSDKNYCENGQPKVIDNDGGTSGNDEDNDNVDSECNIYPCPKPIHEEPNNLVFPWQLNRLDGVGFRLDVSGWLPQFPLVGGGLSFDFIYNFKSNEFSFMPSGYLLGGLGEGGSISPNLLLVYDAPDNDSITGLGGGIQGDLTVALGFKEPTL